MKVKIAISARHVHLNKEDFEFLFGSGSELTKLNDLSQKGEFASCEKVNIITEGGKIDGVRVVGPLRSYTQVEISATDAFKLRINPPVRESGDLLGSSSVIIEHDGKMLNKNNCCIIANRHIHMNTNELGKYNLKNGQVELQTRDKSVSELVDCNVIVDETKKLIEKLFADINSHVK